MNLNKQKMYLNIEKCLENENISCIMKVNKKKISPGYDCKNMKIQ